MQNTKLLCFLILPEKVAIVRKTASHLPQVRWINSKSGEKRLPAICGTHWGSEVQESRNQSQEILSWGTWLASAASQPLGKCAATAVQKRRLSGEHCWAWDSGWGARPAPIDWLGKWYSQDDLTGSSIQICFPWMGHYGPNSCLYFSGL